jgi:peptide/nickel transport system substrate-binding protein
LLTEAGYPQGVAFTLHNRAVDQPYKVLGTWLIGQWKKVGFKVKHRVQPTEAYFASLQRKKDFEVSIDFNCQAVVNPLLDIAKFISDDRTGNNNANYRDRGLDELFDQINRTTDPVDQRRIMREFEKRTLDEEAHQFLTLWFYRIILHRSYVKGWKISPSHYINQDLGNVWLAQ